MATKTTTPVSEKRAANAGGCLVLFGLVFVLAGLIPFVLQFVGPMLKIQAAKGWTATPCVITSSQVINSRDSDGNYKYRVDIEYEFQFGGRKYYGNTYQFGPPDSSDFNGRQSIVSQFSNGTHTTCYVNPSNPNESVLNRAISDNVWGGLVTLIFVAIGFGIVIVGVRMKSSTHAPLKSQSWKPRALSDNSMPGATPGTVPAAKSQTQLVSDSAAQSTAAPQSVQQFVPASGSGPMTLKPRTSRAATFFVLLVFSLFWNVFIWFFLSQSLQKPGGFEVFFGLFMIPFVLVGIGMAGATVYQFIAIFGPKVELTVSQAAVPLGGTININWKLSGRQNVTNLKIFLEGREEATYRRGTDTYTDKNTFCVLDVSDAMSSVTQGNASVPIPANTMHSFEARNNKITWQLVVKGEIPVWPDIKEEYPLSVTPLNMP
jgi:hypothetical protein